MSTTQELNRYIEANFRRRKWLDRLMHLVLFACAIVALVPLFSVLAYVTIHGIPGLNGDFFKSLPAPAGEPGGGMANALVGSLILIGLGSLIGIVWGIAAGTFLSEYGHGKLGSVVRFCTEMLASVPSIVVGLFVYTILVRPMQGFSAVAGGVALGLLMIPTVARSTEEILRLVPSHIREAGLALGLPRWKVISRIVLRGAASGITTGVVLAIARIAGETAPLLFTALNNQYWASSPFQPIASLPVQIFTYAISPFDEWHTLAWAGALVLVLGVFVVNLVTRLVLRTSATGRE